MATTIALMSYHNLTALFAGLNYPLPPGVNVKVVDALLEDALAAAREMERTGEADVFVSAGANCSLLSRHLKAPLVEIKVTGFDFLLALDKANRSGQRTALITYRENLPNLDRTMATLKVPVRQAIYNNMAELRRVIEALRAEGITACIGGSLVCEEAKKRGLAGYFLYSEDSVARALEAAIKIGLAKQTEMAKAEELRAILNFAYEGIIATDGKGMVTVFNPVAEKIVGIRQADALGRHIESVLPSTRLPQVMAARLSEFNQIQAIGSDVKILTNRIPIVVQGDVVGSVATFRDFGAIQEAEEKIRERLYSKGFVAKNTFGDIIGDSHAMAEVKREAARYARSESTVLILGESGTGKELFAQAIHNGSGRVKRPFVAINCAALPQSLLESELFGYEEGAFTGAKKGGKQGLFELAHGGTIFLDEIGEMPLPIQSRLLRVLEEHEVLRIGGERIVPVNIRVIAATNKDLWDMVQKEQFREDLYYRLSVLEVRLPPLYRRREDIPLLVGKFLRELRRDLPAPLAAEIAHNPLLAEQRWPGNVRELRNCVERLAVLYDGHEPADVLLARLLGGQAAERGARREKEELLALLAEEAGNRAAAARKLGVSRTTLWRRLRRFNLG
jgi:propionate catabolism operon transcriptional regulator